MQILPLSQVIPNISYPCLVKPKKKIEVADDDLEVHMLDNLGGASNKHGNRYAKNPWFHDQSSGRGTQTHLIKI